MQTYTFHVQGMHCKSCVVLTESELKELPGVQSVKADLASLSVEVSGDFGGKTAEEVAGLLTVPLAKHGYTILVDRPEKAVSWREFTFAVPIAVGFMAVFFILQKLGIVNLVSAGEINYGTAFLVGLVASVSTCMAIVGGLVLSMSATFAKEGEAKRPQMLFHVGRLVSFFLLGGAIGALGSAFQLGSIGTFVLGLVIGLVMLLLGLNLLDVFHWTKKLQPTMPKFISKHVLGLKKFNHTLTPLLVGVATFFLPCGFTQSMQIYTLSTGNFWTGAMTMFVFALGTLPVLAILSFASTGIHDKFKSGIFFKSAGLVVILFALFNLLNSFAAIGLIPPLFNF